jgi:phosphoribosylcarboxyaminoimidazole (NCAIR) mutase
MPPGIPVATMALGKSGARNAGIFAAQIVALSDPEVAGRIDRFKKEMAAEVERKAEALKDYR